MSQFGLGSDIIDSIPRCFPNVVLIIETGMTKNLSQNLTSDFNSPAKAKFGTNWIASPNIP